VIAVKRNEKFTTAKVEILIPSKWMKKKLKLKKIPFGQDFKAVNF
jgi:hypothetical protein